MSQIDRRLIIDASEVGEFVYCAKAWYLKRCGEVPQGSQLEEGVVFHEEHGAKVSRAARLRKAGEWLALIGFLLLVVTALIWFTR
ncbi:MAG TPA: hypothetical protein VFV58_25715 [Blastocatellia bacterium]|jgi:hypothetical protein|nr:hypothetical protein [Blastocatellia bacterium]